MSRRVPWLISLTAFWCGLLLVASGRLPTASGQPKALAIPAAPQAPTLTTPASLGLKRGTSTELVLNGTNLTEPTGVLLNCPGTISIPTDNKNGTEAAKLRVKVNLPADTPIGLHAIRVGTRHGVSNLRPLLVDELDILAETGANRTRETAQPIKAPCLVSGVVPAEASGFFKVKVAAGQRLTFEVLARRIGSRLDPIIVLHDGKSKRELPDLYADDTPGLQGDCRLTHTFKDEGEIIVQVRDTTYRGGADYTYGLRIGDFPGATVAFPLVAQRGKEVKVAFAGPGTEDVSAVTVKAPSDPTIAAVYATPKRAAGVSGWPVPVRLSDDPQGVEQEPNDQPGKATKVPVPGGVSAKFATKGDIDHFAFTGKKGQKLTIAALTYEANLPTEVLLRVLDAKGAELARSNPAQPAARLDFTPGADGEYVIACEHLNYLYGPNEVYHLSIIPAAPDFAVSLAVDRCEAPAGGATAVAVTSIARVNGFAGPVELSIVGDPNVSGSITVPAGQTQAFIPLKVKAGTKPGAYSFRVRGKATVGGQEVVRVGTFLDAVKTAFGDMTNPPPELLSSCAVGVMEKPPFLVNLTADPTAIEKGKAGKLVVEVTRNAGFDGDVTLAPLFLPPNVTAAVKPVPKGKTKMDFPLTVAAAAATGPTPVVLRATAKVAGKDYAVIPAPLVVEITAPKKVEPKKKDEPKKK